MTFLRDHDSPRCMRREACTLLSGMLYSDYSCYTRTGVVNRVEDSSVSHPLTPHEPFLYRAVLRACFPPPPYLDRPMRGELETQHRLATGTCVLGCAVCGWPDIHMSRARITCGKTGSISNCLAQPHSTRVATRHKYEVGRALVPGGNELRCECGERGLNPRYLDACYTGGLRSSKDSWTWPPARLGQATAAIYVALVPHLGHICRWSVFPCQPMRRDCVLRKVSRVQNNRAVRITVSCPTGPYTWGGRKQQNRTSVLALWCPSRPGCRVSLRVFLEPCRLKRAGTTLRAGWPKRAHPSQPPSGLDLPRPLAAAPEFPVPVQQWFHSSSSGLCAVVRVLLA